MRGLYVKSLIDHKLDLIEPSVSGIHHCCVFLFVLVLGFFGGGGGCRVYASVNSVTFDPEKNKILNEVSQLD